MITHCLAVCLHKPPRRSFPLGITREQIAGYSRNEPHSTLRRNEMAKTQCLCIAKLKKKYSINKRRKDNILSKQQGKPAINSTTYFQRTHNDKTQGECNIFVFSCKLAVLRGLNIEYRIELQYSPKL